MEKEKQEGVGPGAALVYLVPALITSGISLAIATTVGWQLGSMAFEKIALAAVFAVAVGVMHGLLACCRRAAALQRIAVTIVWMVGLMIVLYAHGSFVYALEEHAGDRRAQAISELLSRAKATPPRRASSILADLTKVREAQAAVNRAQTRCEVACDALRDRQAVLNARVEALGAEVEEARRQMVEVDRLAESRVVARQDPLLAKLAVTLGVTEDVTRLGLSVMIVIVLDGAACVCWLSFARHRDERAMPSSGGTAVGMTLQKSSSQEATEANASKVAERDCRMNQTGWSTVMVATPSGSAETTGAATLTIDDDVESVRLAIQSGTIRSTVSQIREFLRCSQKNAAAVRNVLEEQGALISVDGTAGVSGERRNRPGLATA